jgi:hypothetical protein
MTIGGDSTRYGNEVRERLATVVPLRPLRATQTDIADEIDLPVPDRDERPLCHCGSPASVTRFAPYGLLCGHCALRELGSTAVIALRERES